ncbi:arsinothricin resistance N-acetyltransferase ArsN1 family B [Microbulbifer sediminum]|uniref:arsinothricin resistance N-acetyltransferase ArsN1 family B n=1 Tax=Microbulbifer sediminum TaxID=2904250 RepID=UPI001F488EF4|nr:arsinothricin resistance N-acetyltransferase ArsN1 family B [Microbulbifer sediminum]
MIRSVDSADAKAVAEIYNHYIANSCATFEEQPVCADEMQRRFAAVAAQGLPWLVAENESAELVGYAYATGWRARSAYRHSVEVTVYVSHTELSCGWGRQLYDALFAKLEDLPVHVAIGGITLPNPASVALHERFGMKKVAHFEQVGKKFGQWIDVGYWQRLLEDA